MFDVPFANDPFFSIDQSGTSSWITGTTTLDGTIELDFLAIDSNGTVEASGVGVDNESSKAMASFGVQAASAPLNAYMPPAAQAAVLAAPH